MVTTLPRVLVAIVGIEKVVETLADFATLSQMLARSNNGQSMTVYTQMLHGPRGIGEDDGPEEVHVILVDNGRSRIYASDYWEVLSCIRCGACLSACPVYASTGGHAYGWIYSGPIGAVLTPLLVGVDNAALPFVAACAADVRSLPGGYRPARMLLDLRRDLVQRRHSPVFWSIGLRLWARVTGRSGCLAGADLVRWGMRLILSAYRGRGTRGRGTALCRHRPAHPFTRFGGRAKPPNVRSSRNAPPGRLRMGLLAVRGSSTKPNMLRDLRGCG